MVKAMLRDLRAHPGRISMTLIAIVLGVTFVVATWVVSDSAAVTVASGAMRSDLSARVTLAQARPDAEPDSGLTDQDVAKLAGLPGVTRATGVVIGHMALVKSDGKVGDTYFAAEGGTSFDASERFSFVSGRGPRSSGEVALEEQAALEAKVATGDRARLLTEDGTSIYAQVTGIYTYRQTGSHELSPVIAFDPATAHQLMGAGYDRVELFGPDQAAIAASAQAAGYEARTGEELLDDQRKEAKDEANMVRYFLLAFAGVALFAGMFVIANTFTMLVAQRTRHFALLRAVGARRRQVRRAVLAEAGVLGIVGSTIGAGLGIAMAWGAMSFLRAPGETIIFSVSPWAIFIGYLTGVLVTVAAAYGSARRGAAVPPVAALGTDAALPRRSLVFRTVAGSILMAIGVGAVLATSGKDLSDEERSIGMAGALTACLALLLLAPLLASAVLLPMARLISKRGSAVARIAVRNSIRDPRRTAATASALMIGLALVTAFATVGSSLSSMVTRSVEREVPADALTVQSAQRWSGTPLSLVDKVRQVSTVDSLAAPVVGWGGVLTGRGAQEAPITALEATGLGKALRPEVLSGVADIATGALVPKEFADANGVKVGDTITLTPPKEQAGKPVPVKVNGIFENSDILHGIVVDKQVMSFGEYGYLEAIYVTGHGDLRKALESAFADRPDVIVRDRAALIAAYTEPLNLALGIVYGLLGAAVIIAVFGVVNTLALSVLERTREIGVFRALGATRSLVRRTVRRESVVIASYGGLLGVGVGVLLGGVMQHVITDQPIFGLTVPLPLVAGALLAMTVVGVLAAWWPARKAARTDVLAAIATT